MNKAKFCSKDIEGFKSTFKLHVPFIEIFCYPSLSFHMSSYNYEHALTRKQTLGMLKRLCLPHPSRLRELCRLYFRQDFVQLYLRGLACRLEILRQHFAGKKQWEQLVRRLEGDKCTETQAGTVCQPYDRRGSSNEQQHFILFKEEYLEAFIPKMRCPPF